MTGRLRAEKGGRRPIQGTTRRLLVLGAGAMARETAWLIARINEFRPQWELAAFVDRNEGQTRDLDGVPVLSLPAASSLAGSALAICAIGECGLRRRVVAEARAAGFDFATLVHPGAEMAADAVIGRGSIVFAHSTVSRAAVVGEHVQVNFSCTVGHDVHLGDFVTLSPGCRLGGRTTIADETFLGIGVTSVPGARVGSRCVVALGSTISQDIPGGVVAAGYPARPVKSVDADEPGGLNRRPVTDR